MHWIKKNWLLLLLIVFLVIFLLVDQFKIKNTPVPAMNQEIETIEEWSEIDSSNESEETSKPEDNTVTLFVDVKGEVENPGVYQVEGDERVKDVIDRAGGMTEDADQATVNLAQKVSDEMVIYVSKIGEEPITFSNTSPENKKVKINLATMDELLTLNGIGNVKAEAILAHREENGPFTSIEDLVQVSGIGEKTVEAIKDYIEIP